VARMPATYAGNRIWRRRRSCGTSRPVSSRWPDSAGGNGGPGELLPPEAGRDVVHDETGCLQVGVARHRPKETKSPPPKVPATSFDSASQLGSVSPGRSGSRAASRRRTPRCNGRTSELVADLEEGPSVRDRALDLAPVPDDAGVVEETLDVGGPELGDRGRVEVTERAAITVATLQDREQLKPACAASRARNSKCRDRRGRARPTPGRGRARGRGPTPIGTVRFGAHAGLCRAAVRPAPDRAPGGSRTRPARRSALRARHSARARPGRRR